MLALEGLVVLEVVEVEEDVGQLLEEVHLLVGEVVADDWVFVFVGDDADQAEPVHAPLPQSLGLLLRQVHEVHQLHVLDHAVDLAATQLHHRQIVQLLQLLLHPHDDALFDFDFLLVFEQQTVLVLAVEGLLDFLFSAFDLLAV